MQAAPSAPSKADLPGGVAPEEDLEELHLPARPGAAHPGVEGGPPPQPTQSDDVGRHPSLVPYQSPAEEQLTLTPPRSRLPFLVALSICGLVVLGTLAAVGISVLSSSGQGGLINPTRLLAPPASTPVSVDALLDLSYQAMSRVSALQYRSEAGFYGILPPNPGLTSTGAISLTVSGVVAPPSSYTADTDQEQIGQYVVISDTTWSRRNGNTSWLRQPTASMEMGLLNPTTPISFMRYPQAGSAKEVGTETNDGLLLRHLRFKVDTSMMMTATTESALSSILAQSVINVDVWVRDKDHLLDRLSAAVDMGNGQGVILHSSYSNYNGQLVVKAPDSQ